MRSSPSSDNAMPGHFVDGNTTIIIGGGLTGLTAGCVLSRAGRRVRLFERDAEVGGLSKTVVRNGFRFDLGGHRFFTKDAEVNAFVKELLSDELIEVSRSSKIYLNAKFFDYPLKPVNALFGLGMGTTFRAIADYGLQRAGCLFGEKEPVSLEDWVVSRFGRTMFNIYFRDYSEKVWGIDCSRISAEWVAQRIHGLSLSKAIKNAFFRFSGSDLPTLTDRFYYPATGIGRIAERLQEEIELTNEVCTRSGVEQINHDGRTIRSVYVGNHCESGPVRGGEFVSSMSLPRLVQLLNPAPPDEVLEAASRLRFRDLVVVTVMVDCPRVTDQTWIYIQDKGIPFGRIHEPTNWSRKMAPEGKSLLVAEFFSTKGDPVWNDSDENLVSTTVSHLAGLGFIRKEEVVDSCVVRAVGAYPLFEVGYEKSCAVLRDYLGRFRNLHLAGRIGLFKYYNMDHAIASGMNAAAEIMARARGAETPPGDGGERILVGSGL
ncbi:MAG: FAD-dependent oxidoreductase [Nitrospiraceae bacterium]|nr:FAD-dependent oxidoreductase [Nitrospiraceae bacterium]